MNAIIQNCEGVQCCCQRSSGMYTKPKKNTDCEIGKRDKRVVGAVLE